MTFLKCLLVCGVLATPYVNAHSNVPLRTPHDFSGNFGHNATYDPNAIVWRIKAVGKGYSIELDTTKETFFARRLTRAEQQDFWRRMAWDKDSENTIDCIGYHKDTANTVTLCHLDKNAQRATNWVDTEYFYHDRIFGVVQIMRR